MKLIHVTADDIEMGKRDDPESCPIALALKRTFGVTSLCVGDDTVEVNEKLLDLPHKAQAFIEQFDLGLPVNPIIFELDLC